tara:strand:- start:237 stop:785 length:549 start_codon:yes stop_codon:yes gene_type:complete
MREIWKDIPNYEGCYQASSFGNIRSIDRHLINKNGHIIFRKGKVLSGRLSNMGYLRVLLSGKEFLIHRLVCFTFLSDEKPEVNHKDGNTLNNNLSNLEWCTGLENKRHARRNGLVVNIVKGEEHYLCKYSDDMILDIYNDYHLNGISVNSLLDIYDISRTTIYSIINKKTRKYLWKDVDSGY